MKLVKVIPVIAMLLIVFLTGCNKKEEFTGEPPKVTSTNPISEAVSIALGSNISVIFNSDMNPLTMTNANFIVTMGTEVVPGIVRYSDSSAVFNPTADLSASTLYNVKISTGAKDNSGIGLVNDYKWSFTTGLVPDLAKPAITLADPLNSATGVTANNVIKVTFSEPMTSLTINSNTFTLMNGTTSVAGTIVYTGSTATFTPSADLAANTTYTATVTTGAKDLAGNALAANLVWTFTTGATTALSVVNLGAAGNYVILAKTGISNISTSAITGDLGLSPAATSYITGLSLTNATGYATSAQVTGQIFAADMAAPTGINLTTAVENMITAYKDAAGRPTPDFLELGTGNLGGMTLTPGLYKFTTNVTLPSNVTISGGANDVWIFQISQDLLMSNGVQLNLIGGAQAKNIFWQVAGQATFGTTSHFEGIILSMTGITFQTAASFKGRALAQTAIVLDGNAVILP